MTETEKEIAELFADNLLAVLANGGDNMIKDCDAISRAATIILTPAQLDHFSSLVD